MHLEFLAWSRNITVLKFDLQLKSAVGLVNLQRSLFVTTYVSWLVWCVQCFQGYPLRHTSKTSMEWLVWCSWIGSHINATISIQRRLLHWISLRQINPVRTQYMIHHRREVLCTWTCPSFTRCNSMTWIGSTSWGGQIEEKECWAGPSLLWWLGMVSMLLPTWADEISCRLECHSSHSLCWNMHEKQRIDRIISSGFGEVVKVDWLFGCSWEKEISWAVSSCLTTFDQSGSVEVFWDQGRFLDEQKYFHWTDQSSQRFSPHPRRLQSIVLLTFQGAWVSWQQYNEEFSAHPRNSRASLHAKVAITLGFFMLNRQLIIQSQTFLSFRQSKHSASLVADLSCSHEFYKPHNCLARTVSNHMMHANMVHIVGTQ